MRNATIILPGKKANYAEDNGPLIKQQLSKFIGRSLVLFFILGALCFTAKAQYSVPTPLKNKVRAKTESRKIDSLRLEVKPDGTIFSGSLGFLNQDIADSGADTEDESFKIYSYTLDSADYKYLKRIFTVDFKMEVDPAAASLYARTLYAIIKEIDIKMRSISRLSPSVDTDAKNNNQLLLLRSEKRKLRKYAGLFSSINTLTGDPKFKRSFIPLRTNAQTDFYYDNLTKSDFKLLNTVVIQGKDDNSVVTSDVVTGYFSVFKINLSTVIYNTNEADTAATIIDKINNGGGLLNVNINYPLFFRNFNEWALVIDSNLKWASDFNTFGNEIPKDEYVGYFEPSLSAYLEMRLRRTEARLFLNYKHGRVFGSRALDEGIENESGDAFYVSTLYAGINFSNKVRLSANIPLRSIQGIGGAENFTIGIQYTPQDKEEK